MDELIPDLFNWKLEDASDYIQVIVILLVSGIGMYLYTKYARGERTQDKAVARVCKKMEKSMAAQGQLLLAPTLTFSGQEYPFDAIAVDKRGVMLLRIYGRGVEIYGRGDSEEWVLVDREVRNAIPTPVQEVEKAAQGVTRALSKAGLRNVKVQPMYVFADVFETPKIFLTGVETALIYKKIGKFFKLRGKELSEKEDVQAIVDVLTHL